MLTESFAAIAAVVERLAAQGNAGEIELVIATPARACWPCPPIEVASLAGVRVVETPLLPTAPARAAAVRAARAPIVVLGETHVFAQPDWAEPAGAGTRRPMGRGDAGNRERQPGRRPELGRAPDGLRPLPAAGESRETAGVASYNAAFKRASLLELGEALESLLEPGKLARRQNCEPVAAGSSTSLRARIDHLNVSRSRPWLVERYLGGRLFGANRSRNWPRSRALLYAAGSPLVAPLRLVRTLRTGALERRKHAADVRARARARVPCLGGRRGARLSPR